MTPDAGEPFEAEGVLNPASGHDAEGELYLLPRLVASGNVSRVGLARVVVDGGVPVGVEREGVVLAPDRDFERGRRNSGVEDPRTTFVPALGLHLMTYVAYGPLGPRTAVAVSRDLREWQRLGPVSFEYDDALGVDLALFHNKDTVFFPEPVTGPDGVESLAVLHRPVWDLGEVRAGEGAHPPAVLDEKRPSIWIAFVPLEAVRGDLGELTRWRHNRFLAGPEFPFEELKIGAGPAPIRVPEGWLLLHHGVTGYLEPGVDQQKNVNYAAGAMILDADEPWRVVQRTAEPLLSAETEEERSGIVPNVVFPTAIERIDEALWVFYGMADSKIGVARLERNRESGT
ncbi:glycosidase [Leifsonia sp. Leaf336]|uniref:glycoside hydrolase family 130 protein n=1 Tax=Leifsonia sp. Leaf336 TaxID=1736341 RepID=UPI0006FEC09B|nr:glycosidase [Leifsonia sp. Leaf336]KQR52951.1 glycosidase [Leifsonia sp. Leaf336]